MKTDKGGGSDCGIFVLINIWFICKDKFTKVPESFAEIFRLFVSLSIAEAGIIKEV